MKKKPKPIKPFIKTAQCMICGNTYFNKGVLGQHVRRAHPKRGVDLHLTRKDAKYLQLRLSGFTPPPSEYKRGLRILNKLKREGVK